MKYLCIGGYFDGQFSDRTDALNHGYIQYNRAFGGGKITSIRKKRAQARGDILPVSMVWIHRSLVDIITIENKVQELLSE